MAEKLSERLEALAALRRAAPLHSEAATEAAWLEEAAELARRVEAAPCVTVREALFSDGSRCGKLVATTHERQIGQRVRLVPTPQEVPDA